MKFKLMATGMALALALGATPRAFAEEGTIVVAQAEDAAALEKFRALMGDSRPAAQLSDEELAARLKEARSLMGNKSLNKQQVQRLRKLAQDAQRESTKRRQAKAETAKKEAAAQAEQEAQADPAAAAEKAKKQEEDAKAKAAKLEADANKFLADDVDLKSLASADLRTKLSQGRKLIQDPATPKALMPKLRQRQDAIRTAMAEAQKAEAVKGETSGQQPAVGGQQPAATDKDKIAKATAKAEKFLIDTSDVKSLSEGDLRTQMGTGRSILADKSTPKPLLDKVRTRQADLRKAMQVAMAKPDAGKTPEKQPEKKPDQPAAAEVSAEAKAILDDTRSATDLSQEDLRSRLNSTRKVLSTDTLSPTVAKQLRIKLAKDRTEFRRRVALENRNDDRNQGNNRNPNDDRNVRLESDDFYLNDSRRAVTLKTAELERRVLVRRIAIVDTRYPPNRRERWRELNEIDRAELRRRALDDRQRRFTEWRDRRDRGDLNISINIDLSPDYEDDFGRPRPIYLAEAEDDDIERYLVAAPVRPPQRRYTIEEVRTLPEVRQTMPAIEIDTIKFGFNEDFVREEALEALDEVGEAIEKILAAHPGEVFLVEGHTDAVGSDQYNLELSKRRAESVRQALTTYYNINPRNLEIAGYGEAYLRIQTVEAEEENRRVTIRRATPLVGEVD